MREIAYVVMAFTGSMRPTFVGGEIRPVLHIPYSEIHPGDIVLRKFPFYIAPHRAKYKHLGRWVTKGDNNKDNDPGYMNETTYLGEVSAK